MSIHYGAISELEMRVTKRRLFEQVVDRHLMVQRALQEGLGVSRREMEKVIRDTLWDSPTGFLEQLKNQGIGEEAWKSKIAQELLAQKLVEKEVYPAAKVEDAEVEEYYWGHLDDFWLPEAIRARQLVTLTARELSKAQASLKTGETFGSVCASFSVEPLKDAGGDWGWMPVESITPAYLRVLRGLKPGDVSKPLKDAFGYHLFQMIEIRPTRVRTLKEAAPFVRDILLKRERDRQFVEWLTNIKKTAKVEINPDLATVVGVVLEDSRVHVQKVKVQKNKPRKSVGKSARKPVHKTIHRAKAR
jgi:parvulin-like peptidyl-prolyl isomerase